MLNKTSTLYFIVVLAISCSPQEQYVFNEWTHLNLKHKPKEILETYSFSPNSILSLPDSLQEWWLEQPIKESLSYKLISFDTNGFISEEKYHDFEFESTNDSILGDIITELITRNDSIIIKQYSELLPENCYERIYVLDKNGLPTKKIVTLLNRPGIVESFIRDNENRIVKIISKTYGIDTHGESTTKFALNSFADPVQEVKCGETIMYNYDEIVNYCDTVKYHYIYDNYNNWIMKTTISNEEISTIVQRTITYY